MSVELSSVPISSNFSIVSLPSDATATTGLTASSTLRWLGFILVTFCDVVRLGSSLTVIIFALATTEFFSGLSPSPSLFITNSLPVRLSHA